MREYNFFIKFFSWFYGVLMWRARGGKACGRFCRRISNSPVAKKLTKKNIFFTIELLNVINLVAFFKEFTK